MEMHSVVPDVVSSVPRGIIQVNYNSLEVNQGNELTPTQVKDVPQVHWEADSQEFYTLCFTDPDAPSRAEPSFAQFLHWLVVNIPGSDLSKGHTMRKYFGSGPPKGSGLHRYVFLVYKQPKKLEFDEPNESVTGVQLEHRIKFSIKDFASKYNMELMAGNFYQAEYDSYCDILRQHLNANK